MARSLGRSSLIFSALTMVSRILGLVRDMLIARYFDTSITDPFFTAMRIPNTLRRFFAEGSFASAFVPVLSATKTQEPEALPELVARVSGTLLVVLLIITITGVVFASQVLMLVAGGLSAKPEQFALAEQMLRIMFPYILLISMTALGSAILTSHERFVIPAVTPVLLNITLIIACYLNDKTGMVLAWAVFWGGVLQLGLQIPQLKRLGLLKIPRWGGKHTGVRKIMRLMMPSLFGSSVGQLTVLVNTFLATGLATGSVSWLYYADRMVELPVAIIGVALGTVILPKLSALKSSNDEQKFALTLDWALRWGLLLSMASACGLAILAPSILTTLFYQGAFTAYDVSMSVQALQVYGVGAFFLIMVKVITPTFYARHDTKTPVQAGLMAMTLNIFLAVILSRHFGHLGLAWATTLSSGLNFALLVYLAHGLGLKIGKAFAGFAFRLLLANGAMAMILIHLQGDLLSWLNMKPLERIFDLVLLIVIGLTVYLWALFLLGFRPQQFKYKGQ